MNDFSRSELIVLDACVIAGSVRRHVLTSLAEAGGLSPLVSVRILHEARRAIPKTLKNADMGASEKLRRADHAIDNFLQKFPTAQREQLSDHEPVGLPDPDDEHVVALALSAGAQIIVTENLKDFPAKRLKPMGLLASNTDRFVSEILAARPELVSDTAHKLDQALQEEFGEARNLHQTLIKVGLKRTAGTLSPNPR